VADIIRGFGGRMVSILTAYEGVPNGYRRVYIRMGNIDRSRLQKLKDSLGTKASLLYMIDRQESIREIFLEKIN
jgi:acetoin utilization protein AcuB